MGMNLIYYYKDQEFVYKYHRGFLYRRGICQSNNEWRIWSRFPDGAASINRMVKMFQWEPYDNIREDRT